MPRKLHRTTAGLGCLIASLAADGWAAPLVPGLHGKHPLDPAGRGRVLIEELRCAACHEGMGPAAPGPDLTAVAGRLNPAYLQPFIEDPSTHDPGTKMPDLLHALDAGRRAEVAASLTAYLLSRPPPEAALPAEADPEAGAKLFHAVGCVACHSPRPTEGAATPLPGDVGLDHVGRKYRPGALADFLHAPLEVRPDGRMPDLALQRSEAESIAAFLLRTTAKPADSPAPPAATADRIAAGRKAFVEMRCVACHETDDDSLPAAPAAPQAGPSLRLDHGCLSENPGAAPDFQLDDDQRDAIRAALKSQAEPVAPADQVKQRLTQLNCIACHERDGYGGVHPERDTFFHSSEESLGDPSRIPPPLTLTGAKLRQEWMNLVLFNGERVRPYMHARMPRFGEIALKGLPEQFAHTDRLPALDYPVVEGPADRTMRDAAHLLLGNKGLNCIACHKFNGKDGPGMQGLDLMTTYQRLQPAWFDAFMRNPGQLRPGIIMPSFWPDGKAVRTDILDGDTDEQLHALYHFFSLGRSAQDPPGLVEKDSTLAVGDLARVYRGRSRVAGYRGIAVGHPGGLNHAFDAQTGALSALWKGGFVRVNWRGQGAGDFSPAERHEQLSQDVSLLAEAPDPWPARPERTKENPVNPDPLYPRQHGYAFEGYSIGAGGVPTFRYRSGDVEVTDTALPADDGAVLRRSLGFESEETTKRFFRALTGPVEKVSDTVFQTPAVRIELREMPSGTRATLRDSGGASELLIELPLAAGRSNLTLDYALRH